MIVVYIAGPFRAPTEYQRRTHIANAERRALEVWKLGLVALCPHLNTAHFDGEGDDAVWLAGDLELLKRCDAVLMVEGWERSQGATHERTVAVERGMPVFEDAFALGRWALTQGMTWIS